MVNFDVEKPSGKEKHSWLENPPFFFRMNIRSWKRWISLLARVSLLGRLPTPQVTAPSPSLTAPITTRQHCTSRNRHGNWNRQGSERSHMVHMMCSIQLALFFLMKKTVFFAQRWGKSWRFPNIKNLWTLRQRLQVNTWSQVETPV